MEIRTTSRLVTFRRPFRFAGLESAQPPGTYTLDVEEEKVDTLSVAGWRQTGVTLKVTRGNRTEYVPVDMDVLREALQRDGDTSADHLSQHAGSKRAPAGDISFAANAPISNATDTFTFPYSRIYAQGWNVARLSSLKSATELTRVAATNPYKTPHERARWDEGFATGLK
jgi:hypothetical protein